MRDLKPAELDYFLYLAQYKMNVLFREQRDNVKMKSDMIINSEERT